MGMYMYVCEHIKQTNKKQGDIHTCVHMHTHTQCLANIPLHKIVRD